ncbi:MAG TPA: hypothetical protein VGQ11_00745 [Candidatus Acidoferrales bacterium]|jgi:hypothetical protein|nr:hypothetical protein [Candidatus Acidoferrales bacterium]
MVPVVKEYDQVFAQEPKHLLRVFLLALALVLAAAVLASPRAAQTPAPVPPTSKPDACALLSREEIRAVQGSEVRRTVPSEQSGAAFHVSLCYYEAAAAVRSVSLMLAAPDAAKSTRPRDFWNQRFHPAEKEAAKSEKGGKENEEDEDKPDKLRAVAGLGEEAYWESSSVTGALYALQKDSFIRISVGGADSDAVRLEKAKKLAVHALARLNK